MFVTIYSFQIVGGREKKLSAVKVREGWRFELGEEQPFDGGKRGEGGYVIMAGLDLVPAKQSNKAPAVM